MSSDCHVVILGGGITGLSAAFHVARKQPTVQITLVEKSDRFGGWIRSERVEVHDGDGNKGNVLLEAGPRTIRSNSKSILELVRGSFLQQLTSHPTSVAIYQIYLLDLRSEVLSTPRASPSGRNRFLHVTPTPGLQALPSSLLSAFTLPLGRLILRSILSEPFLRANKRAHASDDDESVDAFFTRHFGAPFARTLASALVHGIYAADSRRLSVRAAFPTLHACGNSSIVLGELYRAIMGGVQVDREEWDTGTGTDPVWDARITAAAMLSFRGGMETLVHALVKTLRGFRNVTLRSDTAVRAIDDTSSIFKVCQHNR